VEPRSGAHLGYSREEAVGNELATLIIPPELRERHRHGMAHYLALVRDQCSATHRSPRHSRRWIAPARRVGNHRHSFGPRPFFHGLPAQHHRAQTQRTAPLVQYALANLLSRARRIEEIGSEALATIASLAEWKFGSIWMCDETGERLSAIAHWQAKDVTLRPSALSRARMRSGRRESSGDVLTTGEPKWVHDFATNPAFPSRRGGQARRAARRLRLSPLRERENTRRD
jgi:hypothetical protein